jgi:hypothetical protein
MPPVLVVSIFLTLALVGFDFFLCGLVVQFTVF